MFDGYKAHYAVLLFGSCNHPEAFYGGGIYADNFTAFTSLPKATPYQWPILVSMGAGDYVLNNVKSETFHKIPEAKPLWWFVSDQVCIPDGNIVRYANISNCHITMPDNPNNDRYASVAAFVGNKDSLSPFEVHLTNNVFENITDNATPVALVYSEGNVKTYITDNILRGVNSQRGLIEMIKGKIYFYNNLFEDITTSAESLFFMIENEYFHAKNNTFRSIIGSK